MAERIVLKVWLAENDVRRISVERLKPWEEVYSQLQALLPMPGHFLGFSHVVSASDEPAQPCCGWWHGMW
jgi:hypothetical protein